LSEWHYSTTEILPECIEEPFDKANFEYLSEDEYKKYVILYRHSNDVLNSIILLIFEIETNYLYGELVDHAPHNLSDMEKLIQLLKKKRQLGGVMNKNLIVEDDAIIASGLVYALEQEGYAVTRL
jgi:hypothetical protein